MFRDVSLKLTLFGNNHSVANLSDLYILSGHAPGFICTVHVNLLSHYHGNSFNISAPRDLDFAANLIVHALHYILNEVRMFTLRLHFTRSDLGLQRQN